MFTNARTIDLKCQYEYAYVRNTIICQLLSISELPETKVMKVLDLIATSANVTNRLIDSFNAVITNAGEFGIILLGYLLAVGFWI